MCTKEVVALACHANGPGVLLQQKSSRVKVDDEAGTNVLSCVWVEERVEGDAQGLVVGQISLCLKKKREGVNVRGREVKRYVCVGKNPLTFVCLHTEKQKCKQKTDACFYLLSALGLNTGVLQDVGRHHMFNAQHGGPRQGLRHTLTVHPQMHSAL